MPLTSITPCRDEQWGPAYRRPSPVRIAVGYLLAGLVWVWASDGALYATETQTATGLLLSAGKGTLFFLLTAPALFWLVRRDLLAVTNLNSLLVAVTEGTTDAVFVKGRDGRYLLFNSAGAALVGRPVADVLGRDDTAVFEPDSAERVRAADRRVMESGVAVTAEERLTAGGVERTYLATKAPFRDARGAVVGVIGISRDITDRVRAEAELRDREQLLALVTDDARVGLVVVGPGYEYLFANAAYAEVLGLSAGGIVGRRVPELLPAGWDQIRPRLDLALAGERQAYDLTLPPREGAGSRHYRVMYEPRTDASGRTTVVVVVVDVTDRHRAEAEARTQAEFAQGVLDAVAANVAVLDRDGVIVAVNAAWHSFATEGGPCPAAPGSGPTTSTCARRAVERGAGTGRTRPQPFAACWSGRPTGRPSTTRATRRPSSGGF